MTRFLTTTTLIAGALALDAAAATGALLDAKRSEVLGAYEAAGRDADSATAAETRAAFAQAKAAAKAEFEASGGDAKDFGRADERAMEAGLVDDLRRRLAVELKAAEGRDSFGDATPAERRAARRSVQLAARGWTRPCSAGTAFAGGSRPRPPGVVPASATSLGRRATRQFRC